MNTTKRGRSTNRDIPEWSRALRARRAALGLAQEDVAARSGDTFSQRLVSDLEVGRIQLGDISIVRAAALARALDWTLSEMQRATGLDLGITELEYVGERMEPVYPLAAAADPDMTALPGVVTVLRGRPHPARVRVFLVDSNEMARTSRAGIQEGDHVYTNLDDAQPKEGHIYVIAAGTRAHVRRWLPTPFGLAWMPDNNEHQPIPPTGVTVIGSVYRVVGDRPSSSLVN